MILPDEIIVLIFNFLPPNELLRLSSITIAREVYDNILIIQMKKILKEINSINHITFNNPNIDCCVTTRSFNGKVSTYKLYNSFRSYYMKDDYVHIRNREGELLTVYGHFRKGSKPYKKNKGPKQQTLKSIVTFVTMIDLYQQYSIMHIMSLCDSDYDIQYGSKKY